MSVSFEYDVTYPGPPFPMVQIALTGRNEQEIVQTAFLDTGADATIIPLSVLQQINARRVDKAFARNVDGSRYQIELYSIRIALGSYSIYGIEAIANDRTSEVILGRDALNQFVITLDGISETGVFEK